VTADGDERSRRSLPLGPLAGALVGVPVMAYGIWGLLHDSQRTRPADALRWIVGSALVHDLIALPLLLGASLALVRPLPRWMRATVRTGLAASAVLAVVAWPEIAGYGEDPTNPSLLPRDETAGLLTYLAAVWMVVGLVLLRAHRRTSPAPHLGGALAEGDQHDCSRDGDERSDDVELEDVAGSDGVGDDSADDGSDDAEEERHPDAQALAARHEQAGDGSHSQSVSGLSWVASMTPRVRTTWSLRPTCVSR